MYVNWRRLAGLLAAAWLAGAGAAAAHVIAEPPLDSARTVKDLLAKLATTQGDLHIVLIHGMRVSGRGTWTDFRGLLCKHVSQPCQLEQATPVTDRLMLQAAPPSASYFGTEVWGDDQAPIPQAERNASQAKWLGSQPFVDHYRYRIGGRFLYVHEIDYWPMLLAFKCQYIVYYETQLVGPYKDNIDACAAGDLAPGHFDAATMHLGWFGPTRAHQLLTHTPLSGGAPLLNAGIKSEILDWGITDAVLSLGTLKSLLRESVRCAFTDVAGLDDAAFDRRVGQPGSIADHDCSEDQYEDPPSMKPGSEFAVMSHSLGAFLLMDTFLAAAGDESPQGGQPPARPPCQPPERPAALGLAAPMSGAKAATAAAPSAEVASAEMAFAAAQRRYRSSKSLCLVLENSGTLYFFANQFPLIELGRTQIDLAKPPGSPTFKSALELWAEIGVQQGQTKQIVAFSDPGDILTFEIPPIQGATVYNAYPHNSFRWLGLVEDPVGAHVNYMTNPDVLSAVFGE